MPAAASGRHGGRAWAQSVLIALIWPIFAAVYDFVTYRRRRTLGGFAVFCVYAGSMMMPTAGSDAADYIGRIDFVRLGLDAAVGEPIPAALFQLVGRLDLPGNSYFVALALIYAAIVSAVARHLFAGVNDSSPRGVAAQFFSLAFLFNYPVLAALNARYQLGLWEMLFATLLALEERWLLAALAGAIGVCIHFGFAIFFVALAMLFVTRRLGAAQPLATYGLLVASFLAPSSLILSLGGFVTGNVGGAFADKVSKTTAYAQNALDGAERAGAGADTSWFLLWFGFGIYFALLATGQLLWNRIRSTRSSSLYQLWMLVIIMTACQNLLRGDPETGARIGRNVTALLLLFHALWFLRRRDGARWTLAIALVPTLFYFVVNYRMWLGEASLAAVLPMPFGAFGDSLPRVYEFLSGKPSPV